MINLMSHRLKFFLNYKIKFNSSLLMHQSQQSRLLFSSAKMFKKPLWQTVWTQIRLLLIGAVCSGSMLFASLLVSNVRRLFAANNIYRCIFFLAL